MKKGELTRQHILAQAAPVFNQRGFAGCSIDDVMKATGLQKGGLYRHFRNKEELAVESFRYALQQVVKARIGDLDQISGAIPKLRHVVNAFVHVPSPIPGGCPLMNSAADSDIGSKAIHALARSGVRDWKAKLCKILKEGIHNGEIRKNVEPRRTANAMISMLEGALMICRLEGTREAILDAQTSLETMLTNLAP